MEKRHIIRDTLITGNHMIGPDGVEPVNWKHYAYRLEEYLLRNHGIFPELSRTYQEVTDEELKAIALAAFPGDDNAKYRIYYRQGLKDMYSRLQQENARLKAEADRKAEVFAEFLLANKFDPTMDSKGWIRISETRINPFTTSELLHSEEFQQYYEKNKGK